MKILFLTIFSIINLFNFSPKTVYKEAEFYIIPTSIVETPADNYMFVEENKKGLKIMTLKIFDEDELFSSNKIIIAPLKSATYIGKVSLPYDLKNLKISFVVGYSYSFQEPSSIVCAPNKLVFSKQEDGSFISREQNSSSNGFSFKVLINFK